MGKLKLILGPRSSAPAPDPPLSGLTVSALYDGTGRSGFSGAVDYDALVAADLAKRDLADSKPQAGVGMMYPYERMTMLDDVLAHMQVELGDGYEDSPTLGRNMAVELDIFYENDVPFVMTEREVRTMTSPYRGQTGEAFGFFPTFIKPVGFEFVTPGGPGCETVFYMRVRPADSTRFDSCFVGPFSFFPRLPEHIVVKQLHKTATVAGDVLRNMVDVMNAAKAEFNDTGKAVEGEFLDSGKKWALGRSIATDITSIPWMTKFRPALVGGEWTTWALGDPTNMPQIGYWNPRLNNLYLGGHTMDLGESGGVVVTLAQSNVVVEDHESYSNGFPASGYLGNVFYERFGSGSGAATLIRGRLAAGAPYRCDAGGPSQLKSYWGNFHDLPAKSIEQYIVNYMDRNVDISGSSVGDHYGHMYGVTCERFGGYYSGISCVKDGAANLSILLTLGAGRPAFVGYRRSGTPGDPLNRFYLYAGASKAAAISTGPIYTSPSTEYLRWDELAAYINTNANCIANAISAVDNHSGPDLDVSHIWVKTFESTQPIPPTGTDPVEIVGSSMQFHCTLDVHANGDAWALSASGAMRRNITRRDCTWKNYCGAGEVAVSTADFTNSKMYDFWWVGCCFYNEGGFIDIDGNWQPIAAQGGRVIGRLDSVGFINCVIAEYGRFYTTAEKPKRKVIFGYCFANIGNLDDFPQSQAIGCVSPSWEIPTNAENYRALLGSPSSIPADADLTFADAAGGDFTVIDPSRILCADGVNQAGKYNALGEDMSRVFY